MKKWMFAAIVIVLVSLTVFCYREWVQVRSYTIEIVGLNKPQTGMHLEKIQKYLKEKKRISSSKEIFYQYKIKLSNHRAFSLFYDRSTNKTILSSGKQMYETSPALYQLIQKELEPNVLSEETFLRLNIYAEGKTKSESIDCLVKEYIAHEKPYTVLYRDSLPKIDDQLYYVHLKVEEINYVAIFYFVKETGYLLDYKINEEEMMTTKQYAQIIYNGSNLNTEHKH